MSVSEIIEYDKNGEAVRYPWFRRVFLALVIILVAGLSFGIGRLSVSGEREGVRIEYAEITSSNGKPGQTANVLNAVQKVGVGEVWASKNGERYHFTHCAGAKQIKEENRIVFVSPEAAEAAGYTLAANCKPR